MKGIDKVSLFKIAHSKTRNFRKAYKVSYAVQLGIFLKEVYRLKKLIEERVIKTCKSSNFNGIYSRQGSIWEASNNN